MPHLRTIAVIVILVAAPLWLAHGPTSSGSQWRLAGLSILAHPLRTVHAVGQQALGWLAWPRLQRENADLRRAALAQRHDTVQAEELRQEVDRLRRLLHLKQAYERPTVAAQVIGRDATAWFHTLLIDQGREDGVIEGSIAVVEGGLVGAVFESSPSAARVVLLTDPRFRTAALVQRSRAQGVLMGTVQGRCYLAYLATSDAAQVGDLVVTSGMGGIPRGLVVGRVARVERDPSGLYWQAQVTPAVDSNTLELLLCLL